MLKILDKSIITLNINGEDREIAAKPSDILLYTLRNELGITGANQAVKMETAAHVPFL